MWLYEAPTKITEPFQKLLAEENYKHNEGCNRLAVRMATGTGKTMVMAMLIAWHTILYRRGSSRQKKQHAQTFVVITPGLTVKDRLQALDPKQAGNIYVAENLIPGKYRPEIEQACVRIINFQAFRQREVLAGASVSQKNMIAMSKRQRGVPDAVQQEAYSTMLDRVLGLPSGPQHRNIVVLNDEAHHCYGAPPEGREIKQKEGESEKEIFPEGVETHTTITHPRQRGSITSDKDTEETKRAKQWFGILEGLHKQRRLLVAHDMSATPYYVSHQWKRFSWILSDYDLHEAMEAGLVKIPRVPVDDDTKDDDVKLRELYKNTKPKILNRKTIPALVEKGMEQLYKSYEQRVNEWEAQGYACLPVLIVVANRISNAIALYDWLSGYQMDDGWVKGAFPMLSNVGDDRKRLATPVAMVVHSKKLEDSDTAELKGAGSERMVRVAREIAHSRGEGELAKDRKKAAEYLRQILSTVGKDGQPGENIRCVVSVGMLTEGWDAKTVTHILGFRTFGSQLLCEQVAGRALRRVNYQSMEDFAGEQVLKAEYSEILGIPFHFTNAKGESPPPPEKMIEVISEQGMEAYRITWPQVEMYRRKIQPGRIRLNPDRVEDFDAAATYSEPTKSDLEGAIGEILELDSPAKQRQEVHYQFARYALQKLGEQEEKEGYTVPPNLRRFAQILVAVREWVAHPKIITREPWWQIISSSILDRALENFLDACDIEGDALQISVDLADPPVLDTANIRFETSISGEMPGRSAGPIAYPARIDTSTRRPFCKRAEHNVAVCDSHLEWRIAQALDSDELKDIVQGWARNLHLHWTIPWLDKKSAWHDYVPDFVVRLTDCSKTGLKRHIVLEGKGYDDEHWHEKRAAVLDYWLPGVNASTDDACAGYWTLLEVRPDNWMVERAKEPGLVCAVSQLALSLKQLERSEDVWE